MWPWWLMVGCSEAAKGTRRTNIFKRPPPHYQGSLPYFEDEETGNDSQDPIRSSSFNATLLMDDSILCDSQKILPGTKNETCQSFQASSSPISITSPFTRFLYSSFDIASYCECSSNETGINAVNSSSEKKEPPRACGNICLDDDHARTTSDNTIIFDSEGGFTCGELQEMAPFVHKAQFCPLLSAMAPLCCSSSEEETSPINISLTIEETTTTPSSAETSSCGVCTNTAFNNHPFWLPLSEDYSEEWAQATFCPSLQSIYALVQSIDAQCTNYDMAFHDDWTQRYNHHQDPSWKTLPVHLPSLCNCTRANITQQQMEPLELQTMLCPPGTQIDADKPLVGRVSDSNLTCGTLKRVLMLPRSNLEATHFDDIDNLRSFCCSQEASLPPGARRQRVKTSIVVATAAGSSLWTGSSEYDNLQESFSILVADLVEETTKPKRRWLRRALEVAAVVVLDPITSPQLYNRQNVSCPSYWVAANDTCQTVNASYTLYATQDVISQYTQLTNRAIDEGRLYQILRQVHPATSLAILGTMDTAFATTTSTTVVEDKDKEEEDSGNNKERNVAFVLGIGLGIAVALICVAICFRIAAIVRTETEKQRELAVEKEEQLHQKETFESDCLEEERQMLCTNLNDDNSYLPSTISSSSKPGIEEEKRQLLDPTDTSVEEGTVPTQPEPNSLTPITKNKKGVNDNEQLTSDDGNRKNRTESESPKGTTDHDIFVYGASTTYDSPSQANVAKALFQPQEKEEEEGGDGGDGSMSPLMERIIETELRVRMEEVTSVVDSSSSTDGSTITSEPPRTPIIANTLSGKVKTETLVSGDWEELVSKEEEETDKDIVFATLASGQFEGQEWEVTSLSSSSSSEKASASSSSIDDFAKDLCFQGQTGHIGFPSP